MRLTSFNFFYIIVIAFISTNFSYTQSSPDIPEPNQMPVVKLDLDVGTLSSSFPFDRYFKLEISTKKYQIEEQVSIFKVHYENVNSLKYLEKDGVESKFVFVKETVRQLYPNQRDTTWKSVSINVLNLCKDKDLDKRIKRKKDSIDKDSYSKNPKINIISEVEARIDFETKRRTSKSSSAKAVKIEKNKYQIIIEPLNPGQLYEVVLRKKPSDKELKSIYKVIDLVDSLKRCEAFKEYNSKILSLEASANRLAAPSFLDDYAGFEKNHLKQLSDTIQYYERQLKYSFETSLDGSLRANIQTIGRKLQEKKLNVDAFSTMYNDFLNSDFDKTKEVYEGIRKLGNDTLVEKFDRNRRLKILRNNWAIIDAVKNELQKLFVIDSSQIVRDFLDKDLVHRRNLIRDNTVALDKLYKKASKYVESNFYYSSLVSASTIDEDVKTRNARVIVTDFGIVGSFANNNNGEITFIPRPFTGINLHFGGGIDKDQKLNHIMDKRFWHRYSITIGVTIGKIDNDGFSDFFNGLSPMVGMNYRIQEQIRLGAGILWIREENANPIIPKSPIEPSAYLSISFDFNLFGQIGKLATKVIN